MPLGITRNTPFPCKNFILAEKLCGFECITLFLYVQSNFLYTKIYFRLIYRQIQTRQIELVELRTRRMKELIELRTC